MTATLHYVAFYPTLGVLRTITHFTLVLPQSNVTYCAPVSFNRVRTPSPATRRLHIGHGAVALEL